MPALDKCEPQILSAFRKDGWQVDAKPFVLSTQDRNVYADFSLQRGSNGKREQIIVVEVKCFTTPEQDFAELYGAVGQYRFYRQLLNSKHLDLPLFLAVPEQAYRRLTDNEDIRLFIQNSHIKVVLIDLEQEVIVQWIR